MKTFLTIAAWIAMLSAMTTTAMAGPARFDRTTKTYALTYTFASLPGADGLLRHGGSYDPGPIQTPTAERTRQIEGEIARILTDVNRTLAVATRGNAQIGSLTFVRDTRSADLIIALDTRSDRGGVATPLGGAGDGRPGHFYLYYDYLKTYATGARDGVVDTIAHELCHYLFGLPDEYRDNTASPLCPRSPGPGCLMDNYWLRGTTGALCDDRSHNPLAPTVVFQGDRADSCQAILRRFYDGLGLDFEDAPPARKPIEVRPDNSEPTARASESEASANAGMSLEQLAEVAAGDASGTADERIATVFRRLKASRRGPVGDRELLRLYDLAAGAIGRIESVGGKPPTVRAASPRRALVIAPDPRTSGAGRPDEARVARYRRNREMGVRQFEQMTDPRQFTFRNEPGGRAAEGQTGRSGEGADAAIADLLRGVERDGIEVVTLLVPPGGLSEGAEAAVSELRRAFLGGEVPALGRLRLNLCLTDDAVVSPGLRDLCLRSTGTVLTIADLDEIGAVMQRLALDQAQGNWVIVPEKGILRLPSLDLARRAFARPDDGASAVAYRSAVDRAEKAHVASDANMSGSEPERLGSRIWPLLVEHRPIDFPLGQDATQGPSAAGRIAVELKPFYVDGSSDYELIVGLSRELPGLTGAGIGPAPPLEALRRLPRMGFRIAPRPDPALAGSGRRDRGGRESADAGPLAGIEEDLTIDWRRSTASTLLFKLPRSRARGLGESWYTPVLRLPRRLLGEENGGKFVPGEFPGGTLRYTFSVGTIQAANQVQASIVQGRTFEMASGATSRQVRRATDARGEIHRGTLDPREDYAVLQVEVRAGLPIAGARVIGYSQRLEDEAGQPVRTVPIQFRDDGQGDDLKAGDGIYNAVLGLTRDAHKAAEYRVFVEAVVDDGATIVPLDSHGASARPAPLPAPRFQRATSLQFRVPAIEP